MTTSRIFGIKLHLVSLAILLFLILDVTTLARVLQIDATHSMIQIQLWGGLFVIGGIIAANSCLNIKKVNYLQLSFYILMALIFICLPLLLASSPYSLMELFS